MASTIQIKRGTGSAVPSGLADGELAINLDDGKFYFGSASVSVSDFKFEQMSRIGNDSCTLSQGNVQSVKKSNYLLTNHFSIFLHLIQFRAQT